MRIVKCYNSSCDEYIIRDIEAVYKALTSEEVKQDDRYDSQMVERIIAWLPCIVEIEINGDFDNDWLNITFSNHQKLSYLYNTSIENALLELFNPKKPEDIE